MMFSFEIRKLSPPTTSIKKFKNELLNKFRLFPFRSPLLRESRLLSFPLANKMFQFTRLPLPLL